MGINTVLRGWTGLCGVLALACNEIPIEEDGTMADTGDPPARQDPLRARKEAGKVAKVDAPSSAAPLPEKSPDRTIAERAGVLGAMRDGGTVEGLVGSPGLDASASGGIGGLIGTKGIGSGSSGFGAGGGTFGTSGLGSRGSGLGGGGSAAGLAARRLQPTVPLSQDVVHPGHNPVQRADGDFLSTFSIDVDTGAYTQARRTLRAGGLPAPAAVRTEEFVNYLAYDYAEPRGEHPFSITLEAAPHPFADEHLVMLVGVQGKAADKQHRPPVHLTFLVDTSCSMRGADRLPLAKRALTNLVENLEPRDTVAVATYAGQSRKVLDPTPASEASTILAAISGLEARGGTAMQSGMALAYGMAEDAYVAGEENRVIVLSDGDANIGATGPERILADIRRYASRGITLSTIGFGSGNYRDAMMEQLANQGDGNYAYVDSPAEAWRVFGEDVLSTVLTIARDVKLQVAFDPATVVSYKLIGYENRAIADQDFRNDAVDAGEVGAGHSVTALYDLVLVEEPVEPTVATVHLRYKPPGPDRPARELGVSLATSALGSSLRRQRHLPRAFAMAAFAEKLRGASALEDVSWDGIAELAADATRRRSPHPDRDAELVELVGRARDLARARDEARADRAPQARIRRLPTAPGLSVELGALPDAGRTLARYRNQIEYCYQRMLAQNPALQGDVVVHFTVGGSGSVDEVRLERATTLRGEVGQCVLGRFRRMQFTPPPRGVAAATYAVRFAPR